MLFENPDFAPTARSARIDAYKDMQRTQRQERITVKGQIRIDPRRTAREAEAAGVQPPAARRIVRGAKRDHVVKKLAETLDHSRNSPFEFEGSCRSGVRSELCLEGHRWAHADAEAASLLDEALSRLHARRPSYEEGQREHTIAPDYCAWCASPLGAEASPGRHISYCSEVCASSAIRSRELNAHRRETKAFDEAYKVVMRSRNPACNCDECGRKFQPLEVGARYCSKHCASRARVKQLGATPHGYALLDDRTCRSCGTGFHPLDAAHVYCSPRCKYEGQRVYLHDVECQHCKKAFRPRNPNSKFCSIDCRDEHRKTPQRDVACSCEWCGNSFMAAMAKAQFCGSRCGEAARSYRLGIMPSRLSAHVFDHFISIPAMTAAMSETDLGRKI